MNLQLQATNDVKAAEKTALKALEVRFVVG